jgi:hypothetical protein
MLMLRSSLGGAKGSQLTMFAVNDFLFKKCVIN